MVESRLFGMRCKELIDEDIEKRLSLLPDRLNNDLRRLSKGGSFIIVNKTRESKNNLQECN